MPTRFSRFLTGAVVFVILLCGASWSFAQRRTPRQPAPTATPKPTPSDELRIISTGEPEIDEPRTPPKKPATRPSELETQQERLLRVLVQLTEQMLRLTERITEVEENQRALVNLERLARAEARAETLRAQLRDVQQKQLEAQLRLDELDYNLRSENIERSVSTFGSTRPEEARDQRRRQLENERTKVRAQNDLLEQSRIRLEQSLAMADEEVERLKQKMRDEENSPKPPAEEKKPEKPPVPPGER